MFTQCPECKTIFGFSEEHTQVANGQVRCSQCSHVFVAMEHAMEELPTTNNTQTTTETAPVPAPESNEIATENIVDEPTAEETSTDSDNDDSFSLFDDANDFMAAISDDFVRPEPSIEENIVFNELGNDSSTAGTHTEPAPASVTVTPEPDKSTIESAMAEEKITQPVSAATPEEDEADNLADEWASMLEEEETPEAESKDEALSTATTPEVAPVATPTPEEDEADNLADEWASMLEEEETPEAESEDEALSAATAEAEPVTTPTPEESSAAAETGSESHEETPEPAEQETEDLASEWASMLDDEEDTELTTDIEKIGVPDEATSMESADTTETSDSVTSDESANEEKTDELTKNSSLQDFLQSQLEDLDDEPAEAEALDISLDSLAKQPAEKPPAPPPLETDSRFFDEVIPSEEKTSSGAIMLAWVVGILVSLVLLTSQYIYAMREELSQIASVRPSVIKFCEFTECSVPLYSNIEQIEFISQDVRSHPKYQNALIVTLVFINKSPFYQAYPVIQFKLSDIEQNPVAGRYFLPNSYLDENVNIKEGIKPDTPIRAIIEINDPGERAVNFDFSFR